MALQGSGRPFPAWGGRAFVDLPGPFLEQALRPESQNQRSTPGLGTTAPRPAAAPSKRQVIASPLTAVTAVSVRRRPWDIRTSSVQVIASLPGPFLEQSLRLESQN